MISKDLSCNLGGGSPCIMRGVKAIRALICIRQMLLCEGSCRLNLSKGAIYEEFFMRDLGQHLGMASAVVGLVAVALDHGTNECSSAERSIQRDEMSPKDCISDP